MLEAQHEHCAFCAGSSIQRGRSAKQADFPLPVTNGTKTSLPCKNMVKASNWLAIRSSYPPYLPALAIIRPKHSCSTDNPIKGSFIADLRHGICRYRPDHLLHL